MGRLLDSYRSLFPLVRATDLESADYVSEEEVQRVVHAIIESDYTHSGKVCYVRGKGHQPRSVYSEMKRLPGIRVVNYKSLLPFGLRFIPGYYGLVQIEDPSMLPLVFNQLTAQSTAIIYIFDASLEAAFISAVQNAGAQPDDSFGIKKDPGYLLYLVDEDRDDSPTGMVDFLSYDQSGPWGKIMGRQRDRGTDETESSQSPPRNHSC